MANSPVAVEHWSTIRTFDQKRNQAKQWQKKSQPKRSKRDVN